MRYDPAKHHRRTIRLRDRDYAQAGAYFVTICAQDRMPLFGIIRDGEMILNDAGKMVERWHKELERKYPVIRNDAFICMPNHVHLIIENTGVGADLCVRPVQGEAQTGTPPAPSGGAHTGAPLHAVVRWFKTMTTNEYIRGVDDLGWEPFRARLWQRNYYERIIRNGRELTRLREYIAANPASWPEDEENPDRAVTIPA